MKKAKTHVEKKFVHYPLKTVYALCYFSYKKVYYNLDFEGRTKIYLYIAENASHKSRKTLPDIRR